MRKKLKGTYTLIEQLYTGAQRPICTAAHNKQPPMLIKDTLEKLSVLPLWIEELKKSVARASALTALTRAKAWLVDLEPTDLANDCTSIKEDGSPFNADDFAALTREMSSLAS